MKALSVVKKESKPITISQLKGLLKKYCYNEPLHDSGAKQYDEMLNSCIQKNLELRFEPAKNLNLTVIGNEKINKLQNRKNISPKRLAEIDADYKCYDRILWCGWAWEYVDPETHKKMHFIISGYHRNVFCNQENIEFHFIVVNCSEDDAIDLAGKSNAEDTLQVTPLDDAGKVKHLTSWLSSHLDSKGYTIPLTKKGKTQARKAVENNAMDTYRQYKLSTHIACFTKIINSVMDNFKSIEDKNALTKKYSAKGEQLEAAKKYWKEEFCGEVFNHKSHKNTTLQMWSESQLVNYKQKLLITMAMNPKYDEIFDNPGSSDIHIIIAIDSGQETMTKTTIKKKEREWLKELAALNTNRRTNKRMGIPIHRRVVFLSVFEGQEDKVYEWTSQNEYKLVNPLDK